MENTIDLSENEIKQILKVHLITQGWNPETIRKTNHGLDVIATRGDEQWIITIKGNESSNFVESFVSALGSIVHIMENPKTKYSVALPDTMPFRRLWERLPFLAKKRVGITALFVNQMGTVTEIAE